MGLRTSSVLASADTARNREPRTREANRQSPCSPGVHVFTSWGRQMINKWGKKNNLRGTLWRKENKVMSRECLGSGVTVDEEGPLSWDLNGSKKDSACERVGCCCIPPGSASLGFSSQDWSGVPLPSLIPRICGSKCKTSVEKASWVHSRNLSRSMKLQCIEIRMSWYEMRPYR